MKKEQKNIRGFIGKYLKEDGESSYKDMIEKYKKEEGKSEEEFWQEMKKYAEEVMKKKEISEDELAKIAGGVKYGELGKKGKQIVSYLLVASSMLGQAGGMRASAAKKMNFIERMGMEKVVDTVKEKGSKGIDIIKKGTNKGIEFCKEKPKIAIPVATAAAATGAVGMGGLYFLGKKLFSGKGTSEINVEAILQITDYNNYRYSFAFGEGDSSCFVDKQNSSSASYGMIIDDSGLPIGEFDKGLTFDHSKKNEIAEQLKNNDAACVEFESGRYVLALKMSNYSSSKLGIANMYANMVKLAIDKKITNFAIGAPDDLFKQDDLPQNRLVFSAILTGIKAAVEASKSNENMVISLQGNWPKLEKTSDISKPKLAPKPIQETQNYDKEYINKKALAIVRNAFEMPEVAGVSGINEKDKATLEQKLILLLTKYDGEKIDPNSDFSKESNRLEVVVSNVIKHIVLKNSNNFAAQNQLFKKFLSIKFEGKDYGAIIAELGSSTQNNNKPQANIPNPPAFTGGLESKEVTDKQGRINVIKEDIFKYSNIISSVNNEKLANYLDLIGNEENSKLLLDALAEQANGKLYTGKSAKFSNKDYNAKLNELLMLFSKYKFIISKVTSVLGGDSDYISGYSKKECMDRLYNNDSLMKLISKGFDNNKEEIEALLNDLISNAINVYKQAYSGHSKISDVSNEELMNSISKDPKQ